ncbi:purine-nucleoside phosphorylase [Paenibacillus alginolyticus]|uniref:Purine nucleoside phosphorylase n=1 Tax=Paenibacillus alginolyticus TaxID=59839 RepID=A0ABT4GAN4_9BACL|nr:purine-nucleoside phosphorylase [Paenibacillus alginolyticus]MCY9693189.1 purine-nucleoside phosphorylase [Paenibacillus alginolyticus]MEC0144516.1 purine-nucleoside phosphorylase [Paenibacillus alginolyticus]
MLNVKQQIHESSSFIRNQLEFTPNIGLILGSGLGVLADLLEDVKTIPYSMIPHFPISTVEGHAGELVAGHIKGKTVIMMKGRFHLYEGYNTQSVTIPVRVLKELGVEKLLVTNAAGGVNTDFEVGDLMLISDHINHMGRNPLIGPNDKDLGLRFPDMSEAYSKRLIKVAHNVAEKQNFTFREGVYLANLGPSYETPAEIRMARVLGADAVGMSTVPEVIVARHAGMEVLGISCISNKAAGILEQPLSHDEVIEATEQVKPKFLSLVLGIIEEM